MPSYKAYLASLVMLSACNGTITGQAEEAEVPNDITAPLIIIDTPVRGTMTEDGRVTVSGHVSDENSGVKSVVVNGQEAELNSDGTFTTNMNLIEGITMLESVVTDNAGNRSDDLRAILNGQMADQGSTVKNALVGNVNRQTLNILGNMVTDLAEDTNFGKVGRAFNPLVNAGTSCNGVTLDLETANKSGVDMKLNPTAAGIEVEVIMYNLDVDMNARFSAVCVGGSAGVNISATRLSAKGLLDFKVTAAGNIKVTLDGLQTSFKGFDLDVGAIPDVVVNLFNGVVEKKVKAIIGDEVMKMVPPLGEKFLSDFTKSTLKFNVLGDTLNIKLRPADIAMSNKGIAIRVDGSTELKNVQGASYLTSPSPVPTLSNSSKALNVGLADDIANQLMASLWASGAMETLIEPQLIPQMRNLFGDSADDITANLMLPPVVSTDSSTGAVRLTVGDLVVRVADPSGVLVEFAVSAEIDLKLKQDGDALKLITDTASVRGKLIEKSPNVVLNIDDSTVAAIAELAIKEISKQSDKLFETLPLPTFGAVMIGIPEVKAADGYLLLDAALTY